MGKRKWIEIAVYFDDNWVQYIKREDVGKPRSKRLSPELAEDIGRFYKDLKVLLEKVEN